MRDFFSVQHIFFPQNQFAGYHCLKLFLPIPSDPSKVKCFSVTRVRTAKATGETFAGYMMVITVNDACFFELL